LSKTECPKCGNTIGFCFGTCVNCGWNHLDNEWTSIQVNPNYLPYEIRQQLINIHAEKYSRRRR